MIKRLKKSYNLFRHQTDILIDDGIGVSVEDTMEIAQAHEEDYGPNSFHDAPFNVYIIKKKQYTNLK